jgi:hypothetical protein
MNITLTAASAVTPTIANVENINVDLDYFTGTAADFNATNVTGATITVSSSKLGFNGVSGVANAGRNAVVAGENVDDLTVTGINGGSVNTGSAADADLTAAAATSDVSVTVNGDINLVLNKAQAFDEVTLTATADADVDLTTSATADIITVEGDSSVVISGAETQTAGKIVGALTAGTVTADIDAAGAVDADEWDVDTIRLSANIAAQVDVATGANVEVAVAQTGPTGLTLNVAGTGTTDEVNVSVAKDTHLTGTGIEVTNIAVTDEVTFAQINTGDKVVLTGSSDVIVTTTDSDDFDASAFTGELTLTAGATGDIKGGTGANNITLTTGNNIEYTGGAGVDTVDADDWTANDIFAMGLGGGNDVVKMSGTVAGTVVIDGGAGTDTIMVTNGTDTSGADLTLTNVEKVELENITNDDGITADTTVLTVAGSQFTGTSTEFFTDEADDTANINVTVDGATTDLSKLVLTNIDAVAIVGRDAKDTIIGTSGDDTITASQGSADLTNGADILTGGAGDDTFVIKAGDSSATAILKITDYQAAAASADNDTLKLTSTNVVAKVVSTDVTSLTAGATVFADASNTVNYEVNDGVLSLTGLSADLALVDTLAEMVSIAAEVAKDGTQNSIAFEFGDNTYVLEDDGDATTEVITNVIELTGVTGIAEMGAVTAGADVILLG